MALEHNNGNDQAGAPKEPRGIQPHGEAGRHEHIITAADAGWITPTAFVLPVKFVPVDPPRLVKRKPPAAG